MNELEKHNNSLECMKNCYAIFFFDKLKLYYAFKEMILNVFFVKWII